MEDIVKSEIKLICEKKWRFDFRDNGYVKVINITDCPDAKIHFLHAPDIESCLSFVYSNCSNCGDYVPYDQLENAS